MASEVELERMLVRLVGDGSQYQQMLQQAQQQTTTGMTRISGEMDKHSGSMHLGSLQVRHGLHILGAASGEVGERLSHMGLLGFYGFHIVSEGAEGLVHSLGAVKAAIAGTGIGLLIVGAVMAFRRISETYEEAKKLGEAASTAFALMAEGATTAEAAIAKTQAQIVLARTKEAVQNFATDIALLAHADANMAAITWRAVGRLASGGFLNIHAQLEHEMDKSLHEAQAFALVMERMLSSPQGRRIREIQGTFAVVGKSQEQIGALRDELRTMGMVAEQSIVLRRVSEAAQATGRSELSIIRELAAGHSKLARAMMERISLEVKVQSAKEAQKVFDETRTPMEQFARRAVDLNRLLAAGYLDFDTYARGVNRAATELLKLNQVEGTFAATLTSEGLVSRLNQMRQFAGPEMAIGLARSAETQRIGEQRYTPPGGGVEVPGLLEKIIAILGVIAERPVPGAAGI